MKSYEELAPLNGSCGDYPLNVDNYLNLKTLLDFLIRLPKLSNDHIVVYQLKVRFGEDWEIIAARNTGPYDDTTSSPISHAANKRRNAGEAATMNSPYTPTLTLVQAVEQPLIFGLSDDIFIHLLNCRGGHSYIEIKGIVQTFIYSSKRYGHYSIQPWVDNHSIPKGFEVPFFDLGTFLIRLRRILIVVSARSEDTTLPVSSPDELMQMIDYSFNIVKVLLVMVKDNYLGEESSIFCGYIYEEWGKILNLLRFRIFGPGSHGNRIKRIYQSSVQQDQIIQNFTLPNDKEMINLSNSDIIIKRIKENQSGEISNVEKKAIFAKNLAVLNRKWRVPSKVNTFHLTNSVLLKAFNKLCFTKNI